MDRVLSSIDAIDDIQRCLQLVVLYSYPSPSSALCMYLYYYSSVRHAQYHKQHDLRTLPIPFNYYYFSLPIVL